MKKIIHVNQHVIRSNLKHDRNEPAITVKTIKDGTKATVLSNEYCHSVEINGPSIVRHEPEQPLSCGARVWIETEASVILRVEPGVGDLQEA